MREEGLNSFTIPSSPLNHTAAFVEELRRQNISHLANFYGFDEFNGPMSDIASAFAPLKAAFPEISTLTTGVRDLGRPCASPLIVPTHIDVHRVCVRNIVVIAYWLAVRRMLSWAGQNTRPFRCASTGGPISGCSHTSDELPPEQIQYLCCPASGAASVDIHFRAAVRASDAARTYHHVLKYFPASCWES